MAKIILYTVDYCPYCMKAKKLLIEKGAKFEDHDITANEVEERKKLGKMIGLEGRTSVPQVFINEKHIGGYSELKKLNDSGELDKML